MDENQFRAEIAEIFREQDRRFERAQKRMERHEAEMEKTEIRLSKAIGKNAKAIERNSRAIEKNTKSIEKNAKAIERLSDLWTDFVDVYRFREQSSEQKIADLSIRVDRIEKDQS